MPWHLAALRKRLFPCAGGGSGSTPGVSTMATPTARPTPGADLYHFRLDRRHDDPEPARAQHQRTGRGELRRFWPRPRCGRLTSGSTSSTPAKAASPVLANIASSFAVSSETQTRSIPFLANPAGRDAGTDRRLHRQRVRKSLQSLVRLGRRDLLDDPSSKPWHRVASSDRCWSTSWRAQNSSAGQDITTLTSRIAVGLGTSRSDTLRVAVVPPRTTQRTQPPCCRP